MARLLHQLNHELVADVPLVVRVSPRLTDLRIQRLVRQVHDKVAIDLDDAQPFLEAFHHVVKRDVLKYVRREHVVHRLGAK